MQIQHLGELTHHGPYWRLVYDRCQHIQIFAALRLEEVEFAVRGAQRYYVQCLACRAEALERRQGSRLPYDNLPRGENEDTRSAYTDAREIPRC